MAPSPAPDRRLRASPVLGELPAAARGALAAALLPRRVRAGQVLTPDDEPLLALVLVRHGHLELRQRGPDLRAPLALPLGPGAVAGAGLPGDALSAGLRALDDAELGWAEPAAWAAAAADPLVARALADLRLRDRALGPALAALRRSPVLRRASARELAALLHTGSIERWPALALHRPAGGRLDGLRILLQGEVLVRSPHADATVRMLGPGEVLGDLELVSGRPLPVDLVAGPREVLALAIPEAAVLAALRARPLRRAILAGTYGSDAQRKALVERVPGSPGGAERLALLPDRPGRPLADLALALARSLRRQFRDRVAVLTAGATVAVARDEDGVARVTAPAGADPTAWPAVRGVLQRADLVLLVAEAEGPWTVAADRVVRLHGGGPVPPGEVVALLPAEGAPPAAAPRLPQAALARLGSEAPDEAIDRLARALTDRRVGVALGGGGALALGHAALLRAIHAAGLPVDLVAGVSGGAVVGAFYAVHGLPGLDRLEALGPALARVQARCWLSSRPLARFLDPHLGGARLEDLARPLYPVATDADRGVQVHIDRGPVAAAIRASAAFPGTFGPATLTVQGRRRRLVDGGVVNLVPDDTAALEGARVVLASNVLAPPRPRPPRPSRLPPALARRWEQLDPRLRLDDALRAATHLLHAPVDFDTRPVDVRFRAAPAPWSPADWGAAADIAAWHARDPQARARIEAAVAELAEAVRALRWRRVKAAPVGVSVGLSVGGEG